jgi:hypothetical protein
MRALIDSHEAELADVAADRAAGVSDRRAATFEDVAWAWHEHGARQTFHAALSTVAGVR